MEKLKAASFFAGVGGIDLGFEQTGKCQVIYANEFDPKACETYEANFNLKVDCRDVHLVKPEEIPDFDLLMGGFPCQSFSIAGYRQGFNDEKGRGTLFFELVRIMEAKKPKIIFLENVKNLVGHDDGNTFRVILEYLEDRLHYHVKYQVLNAKEYGNVPHGRERIYIVGFQDEKLYEKFEFPRPIPLTRTLSDCIGFDVPQDRKYYYNNKNCGFFSTLERDMTKPNTIYQWRRVYVRENKSNVCPTLTANMGTGGHNVPLILSTANSPFGHIRKLTPRECFNLQGFPDSYVLPSDLSNVHLYKQAGNSVVVPVINRIAEKIFETLKTK
jgi:DNA (cytosine-5)-methyltransferase 1